VALRRLRRNWFVDSGNILTVISLGTMARLEA